MGVVDVTAPVLPGETLAGKYRVERVLGKGGMGIVVAARHLELDERVAIKFLLRQGDPVAVERFMREARAAAKVKNEHVCRVHDVGRLPTGEPYIVMEYLDGCDLATLLAREGKLSVAHAAALVIEACVALSEAHALGIVHRDLKPANLFVAERANGARVLKVLDFGISKLPNVDAMTTTSVTMGSPAYMSPEQLASSRDVDARTDIWSLGVILFELVTGKLPFAADSLVQLTVQIREVDAPPVSSVQPDVSSAFGEVIAKCMRRTPGERIQSAAELARALAPFAEASVSAMALTATALAATASVPPSKSPRAETLASLPQPEPQKESTLDPMVSRSGNADLARPARWVKWGALTFAVGAIVMAMRYRAPDASLAPATADAQIASPTSSPAAALPPLARPTASEATSTSTFSLPAPSPSTPKHVVRVVDAGSAPAISEPPSAVDAGKRKRTLDRTDPYE